jgi:hypothetical protein
VAVVPSKRLRNKIAGFATHLMKRIQVGPVRGISLKLQEEVEIYYGRKGKEDWTSSLKRAKSILTMFKSTKIPRKCSRELAYKDFQSKTYKHKSDI